MKAHSSTFGSEKASVGNRCNLLAPILIVLQSLVLVSMPRAFVAAQTAS